MVSLFYKMQFRIGCNKLCTLWNKILRCIFGLFYPIWIKINVLNDNNILTGKDDIIVSLTSFPNRIPYIKMCIHSLLRQSMKPGKIILWLSVEQFPNRMIPEELKEFIDYGLDVRFCEDDLKPHKKLYYSMLNFPDSIIITVDDDVVYSEDLVEKLYAAHLEHKDDVCCNLAHEITLTQEGVPDLYDNWWGGAIGKSGRSNLYCAIGVGGILYPPHCFGAQYFDFETIKKLSLYTDDLWLKYNEILDNRVVYKRQKHGKIPFEIAGTQKAALTKVNNGAEKRNDTALKLLQQYFNINWDKLDVI